MTDIYNTVIIGSGPAGLTAAIYAARAGLNPILIKGFEPGGQLMQTPEIGNWPGAFENPSGSELMDKLTEHAGSLGVVMLENEVTGAALKDRIKTITLDDGRELNCRTVIIATGAKANYLGVPGESKYLGQGVSACATCDGFFFRGKEVAVVGGGSAAFVEALFLSSICKKVSLIHRREGFRAEAVLVDKLKALQKEGKIEFILNATISEVVGDESKVTALKLAFKDGKQSELKVDGLFVAIGHSPATSLFTSELENDSGYLKVGFNRATATSVPGVFACGDCADRIYRQAITSAGTGCMAALDVEHFLMENA